MKDLFISIGFTYNGYHGSYYRESVIHIGDREFKYTEHAFTTGIYSIHFYDVGSGIITYQLYREVGVDSIYGFVSRGDGVVLFRELITPYLSLIGWLEEKGMAYKINEEGYFLVFIDKYMLGSIEFDGDKYELTLYPLSDRYTVVVDYDDLFIEFERGYVKYIKNKKKRELIV